MIFFGRGKAKKTSETAKSRQRVTPAESYAGVKVSSYYTVARRSGAIDSSKRGSTHTTTPIAVRLRRFVLSAGLYSILGVIVVISVVYSLYVKADPIIIESSYLSHDESSVFSKDTYYQSAKSELQNNILNNSKLTLRAADIKQAMMSNAPEIASMHISLDALGARPRFVIYTYQPIFALKQGSRTFLVLENGALIESTEGESAHYTLIKDDSGVEATAKQRYVRQDDIAFLSYVKTEVMSKKQWGIDYFRLTDRPREVVVKATGQPYEVKMYFDEDGQQQVGSWFAALKKLGEGGEAPSEYIDVRVGEKVFYK